MDPTIVLASYLWLNPPKPEPVTLDRSVGYEIDVTRCDYSDGTVELKVYPRWIVKDGYDSKMRCEHLRCLIESGETCW